MIYLKQTQERFEDIYSAREAVLRFAASCDPMKRTSAELVLDAGTYFLHTPLVFDKNVNPELTRIELTFSCNEGRALFTSAKKLSASDFTLENGVYVHRFPKGEDGKYPLFRDLYCGGKRAPMCTSDTFIHAFAFSEKNGRCDAENLRGFYVPEEAARLLWDGELCPMELVLYVEWEFYVMHAISVKRDDIRLDNDGNRHVLLLMDKTEFPQYVKGVNRCLQPENREFFFRNHPAFLKDDTWCYDHTTGTLYYKTSENMLEDVAIPLLDVLIFIDGMDGIRFSGISFTGVSDKYTCENGYLSGQANVEKRVGNTKVRSAALLAVGVRRFSVTACDFYAIGANGILMLGNMAMVYIRDSVFEDIAMSAISIGDPVRAFIDRKCCSYDVRVENNFISHIGYEYPSAPAIDIFRVDGVSVCRNTIEYCAYSGVSIGWEWSSLRYALGEMVNIRDADVAYNRITHHMQILRDGGAIYVVGSNCTRENKRYFNFMHDNFAYRDSVKRTVRGYYLDGSSSNWHVYDNVVSGAQRPAFAQFIVEGEYTYNNVIERTYTTEPVDEENHCPERNTIVKDVFTVDNLESLFREYPQAKKIYENSGCDESVRAKINASR